MKYAFFLLFSLALFISVPSAFADVLPAGMRGISHKVTFHGAKAFPKHRFVLLSGHYNWPAPSQLKEGQTLPFLKFGGILVAVPLKAWNEHFAKKPNKLSQMKRGQVLKMGFPKTKRSFFISRFVRDSSNIASRVSKLTVTGIKGKILQIRRTTRDFDKAGKLIPRKTKGKKTSMRGLDSPSVPRLALLPIGVFGLGLLVLLLGIRRKP